MPAFSPKLKQSVSQTAIIDTKSRRINDYEDELIDYELNEEDI